jgi:hypothetical protein
LPAGGTASIIITQDSSGNQTGTFYGSDSTAVSFAGGVSTLSTASNETDVVSIFNTGGIMLGTLQKDFK